MDFPHVINGVAEEDLTTKIFACMAHFDIKTLLACREASKGWRDGIDSNTTLWARMSLMRAVKKNRVDIVKHILEFGKDKGPADYIDPLLEAAWKGHLDIFRLIVERVDNPNPADEEGLTPLNLAAWSGHLDIVSFIIDRVANTNSADENKNTLACGCAIGSLRCCPPH